MNPRPWTTTPCPPHRLHDAGFVPGSIGYFSAFSGSVQGSTGVFDNLQVIALREEVVPIPEPGSLAMWALLVAPAMLAIRRNRRRAAA